MLKHKLDTLKLLKKLHTLNRDNPDKPRHSLVDVIILLTVNEHPKSCKADLTELIYDDRTANKSCLDRPITRLVSLGHIDASIVDRASTRKGDGRTQYQTSKSGRAFLKSCAY